MHFFINWGKLARASGRVRNNEKKVASTIPRGRLYTIWQWCYKRSGEKSRWLSIELQRQLLLLLKFCRLLNSKRLFLVEASGGADGELLRRQTQYAQTQYA